MLLIMLGGAIGSYLRYWLPTLSVPASLGALVAGGLGSCVRYLLGRWFNSRPWGQAFPYGTLVINVSGSFILGLAGVTILEGLPEEHHVWYLWIGTGFCGGFTTFSTFEWETFKLVRDGSHRLAFANVLGSVLAGFLVVVLAAAIGRLFVAGQPGGQAFPYATFAINVSGSFILGGAGLLILERMRPEHQDWYLLVGTGFCGGYTTFSTFEWETFRLVRDGSWWLASANVLGSVVAGFLGVMLGAMLVSLVFRKKMSF
jgi:CrcB protein